MPGHKSVRIIHLSPIHNRFNRENAQRLGI